MLVRIWPKSAVGSQTSDKRGVQLLLRVAADSIYSLRECGESPLTLTAAQSSRNWPDSTQRGCLLLSEASFFCPSPIFFERLEAAGRPATPVVLPPCCSVRLWALLSNLVSMRLQGCSLHSSVGRCFGCRLKQLIHLPASCSGISCQTACACRIPVRSALEQLDDLTKALCERHRGVRRAGS